MKELEKNFMGRGETKGFAFTQLRRSNFAYIYEVTDTFGYKWYECFKRKENTRFNTISYPRQNAWGIWAWTETTLQEAEEKFDEINKLKD